MSDKAQLIEGENGQIVVMPKEYWFDCDQVRVWWDGPRLIIEPCAPAEPAT